VFIKFGGKKMKTKNYENLDIMTIGAYIAPMSVIILILFTIFSK